MEGLLSEVNMSKKGVVPRNVMESKVITTSGDILYQLNEKTQTNIGHTLSALFIGYRAKSFIVAISSTVADFSDVSVKLISGKATGIKFFANERGIFYKCTQSESASYFCLTMIANGIATYYAPLFTTTNEVVDNMREIRIE